MSSVSSPPASYHFEAIQLFPVERRLLVDGEVAAIGARAFDVLLALVERHGRVVTRDELLDICWPGSDVEPNNIAVQIGSLRRLLGRHVIASIPGRGYQFSAVVREQRTTVAATQARAHRTNIPELGRLIGRDDDLRFVSDLLDANRLVTIIGAGGIGKTRLALHALEARRNAYRHGVCWVELGDLTDAASLPGSIAAALGIGEAASLKALEAAVAPLEILVALDNAEHLIEGVAALVNVLLQAAPAMRVLVTSQAPLRLPQEQLYRVGPLAMPPGGEDVEQAMGFGAVTLFVQRARAADTHFVLAGRNIAAVVDLCRQLDGLPLAIELAAARVRLLDVAQIAASMHQCLQLLTGGFRNAPARQRTVAAALEWSHQLLSANERIVFRRLAVVVGSASFELVQAIAADVGHVTPDAEGPLDAGVVVEALAGLVDRSLVAVVVNPDAPQVRRYRLLDMPRAYATERLAAAGEADLLGARHARAVAALMTQAWVDRWSGAIGYSDWNDRTEVDRLNGRAACAWARQHDAVDLVIAMAPILLDPVLPSAGRAERLEIAEYLDRELPALPPAPEHLPARMMLMRFWDQHDVQRSLAEATRALALAERCGERFAAYFVLSWQLRLHVMTRDDAAAEAVLARVNALEDPDWPAIRLWIGAAARCYHAFVYGSSQVHVDTIKRSLVIARLAGDTGEVAASNLIDAQMLAGAPDLAAALGWQLLRDLEHTRKEYSRLIVRINLLAALLALPDTDTEAARPVGRAAWRTSRHFALQGDCADHLALLAAREQRWTDAAALMGFADAVYADRGVQRWRGEERSREQTLSMGRAAIGDDAFERARAEGERLSDVEVEDIAFARD